MAKKNAHPGCLFLFGMPFAGVGVLMMVLTFNAMSDWRAAKAWVEVPAELHSVNLNSYSDEDGTTYSVEASYSYRFKGESYSGDRVGVFSGADNIGSFHHDLYDELSEAKQQGEAVCFVDPDDPEEAILNRDMRWGMVLFYLLFLVTFGGVGFGMMGVMGYLTLKRMQVGRLFAEVSAFAAGIAESGMTKTATDRPGAGRPVMEKVDRTQKGSAFVLQSEGAKKITRKLVTTAVFNLMLWPLVWIFWPRLMDLFSGEWSLGDWGWLAFLVLPLLGVALAVGAVRDMIHWRKFGLSTLSFREPPRAGRTWYCILTNHAVLRFDQGFRIELSHPCAGKESQNPLTDFKAHPHRQGELGLHLPFQVMAPDVEPPRYLLTISADIPGLDYRVEFPIDADD